MTEKKRTEQTFRVDVKEIKGLAIENIELVFESLGITDYEHRYSYITACCPVHNGDNSTAFSFSLDREIWSCFSNECHKKHGNDIISLICAIKEISFKESIDWLCLVLGIERCDVIETKQNLEERYLKSFSEDKRIGFVRKTIYDRSCLKRLSNDVSYFIKRRYEKRTLDEFQAGLATKGKMNNRIVFPVCDIDGNIIGFVGRTTYEKCNKCNLYHRFPNNEKYCRYGVSSKWKNSKGLKTDSIIYNLHRAKNRIKETGILIIVEGIPDCMRLWEAGVTNVICLLRGKISSKQIISLLSLGFIERVFICTDRDKVGKNFKNKHITKDPYETENTLGRYFNVEAIELPEVKDIGEMSTKEAINFAKEKEWI